MIKSNKIGLILNDLVKIDVNIGLSELDLLYALLKCKKKKTKYIRNEIKAIKDFLELSKITNFAKLDNEICFKLVRSNEIWKKIVENLLTKPI